MDSGKGGEYDKKQILIHNCWNWKKTLSVTQTTLSKNKSNDVLLQAIKAYGGVGVWLH